MIAQDPWSGLDGHILKIVCVEQAARHPGATQPHSAKLPGILSIANGLTCFLVKLSAIPCQSAKFPVSNHRELAEDALDLLANVRVTLPILASNAEICLYFPAKQGIEGGDGFADDCLHRQFLGRRHPQVAAQCKRAANVRNGSEPYFKVRFEPVS